jgi:hypothetical protein
MFFHDMGIESIYHSSSLDTRASRDAYKHSTEDVFQSHDSSEEAVASIRFQDAELEIDRL